MNFKDYLVEKSTINEVERVPTILAKLTKAQTNFAKLCSDKTYANTLFDIKAITSDCNKAIKMMKVIEDKTKNGDYNI